MIRVAILGAGIGAQHLAGYRALPDRFQPAVLCDLDAERAAAVVGDAAMTVATDIDATLADPAIDLIDVCLPPHLHFPVAKAAMAAGKHVVIEKPITRSLAEADALIAASNETGRRAFPVFQYRYGDATAQLDAVIAAGLAGAPRTASIETHWNRGAGYYAEAPWRGTWAREAGGAVLSHAIHNHDLLFRYFGPAAHASAETATLVNAIETEDCASIALRMENGALASCSVTLGAATDETRLRFVFAELTAESGRAPYKPAEDAWTFTARDPARQPEIDAVVAATPKQRPGFEGFLEAVADALDDRRQRAVSLADGRRSIELVTAVYHAARTGTRVSLPLGPDNALYHGWTPG